MFLALYKRWILLLVLEVFMTHNYYKGKITVVFPATEKSPLYGKILPIWGKPDDKSAQINFNMFALRENQKFPEEGGACEIDFKDSFKWVKKENGGKEFYLPKVPFMVYFKIKTAQQKDGSQKLVAVAIYSPDKLSVEEKTKADSITRMPSKQELGIGFIPQWQEIENAYEEYRKNSQKKHQEKNKSSKNADDNDFDELDLENGEALEAVTEKEYEEEAANFQLPYTTRPYDNSKDEPEETEEEETEEETEDDQDFDEEESEYDEYYEEPKSSKNHKKKSSKTSNEDSDE